MFSGLRSLSIGFIFFSHSFVNGDDNLSINIFDISLFGFQALKRLGFFGFEPSDGSISSCVEGLNFLGSDLVFDSETISRVRDRIIGLVEHADGIRFNTVGPL